MVNAPAALTSAKSTMSERRAVGLRHLVAAVSEVEDFESSAALPLSGYVCGCCATPLPVGVLGCPHCHTAVADTTPRPDHPAGSARRPAPVAHDDIDAAGRTRDIRRSWLRRPDRETSAD